MRPRRRRDTERTHGEERKDLVFSSLCSLRVSVPPWSYDSFLGMSEKIVINLKTPLPASDDCLPHAAMTLGSVRGLTTRPSTALVHRIVVQEQSVGHWIVIRMDDRGGFIGDTSHPTKEDALRTVKSEFGIDAPDKENSPQPKESPAAPP